MNAFDYAARLLWLYILWRLAALIEYLNRVYGVGFCPVHHEWEVCR